jgi:hypothetical protein
MKVLWRKFRDLPPFQRAIAIRASALLPVALITLRILGLRHSLRVLGWLSRPKPFSNAAPKGYVRPLAETIAHIVQAVARHHPLRSNCLSQSLVLWSLLRQWGVDSHLRIGVNKQAESFAAHAWVEHRGQILGNDRQWCQQFRALDRLITSGP